MGKQEIYYKFVFPDDNNLLQSPGHNQVKILRDNNPHNVLTYNTLNSSLKSYIDQYLNIPKYYDIRNFRDADVYQRGGLSLIVSHSPEVNSEAIHGWTKFKASDGSTVYCSLVVSSGNFFYNWNLPEEVLAKSNLRDKVVRDKFHSNWYFTPTEQVLYRQTAKYNPQVGQEKRVFIQSYFNNSFNYGHITSLSYYINYTDEFGNVYPHSQIYYRDNITPESGPATDKLLDPSENGQYYIKNSNGEPINVTKHRYSSATKRADNTYYIVVNNIEQDVELKRIPERYSDISEDLKKDFIDLEVTRRILHPEYDYSKVLGNTPANSIPIIISGIGKDTVLSYDRPTEYVSYNPMPLRYDLLRNTLNDKDPYGDQETVLVMWVANKDPADSSVKTLADLQSINFRQYAIPVSVRCYIKSTNEDIPNTSRFLVSYPSSSSRNRFHIRRNDPYNKNLFKEAVYLPGLIEYSNDYIIAYQNTNFVNARYNNSQIFDIQNYLFKTHSDWFKALYIRKQYSTNQYTQHQQNYYLLAKSSFYHINPDLDICIEDANSAGNILVPKNHFLQSDYSFWDFNLEGSWNIINSWFIALFDASNVSTITGSIKLVDCQSLRDMLATSTSSSTSTYTWDDLYLSSLGISQMRNWSSADFLLGGLSDPNPVVPLGFLDNHISINNIHYGSNINGKIIIGFKNVFDYSASDAHHFSYNLSTNQYELVNDNSSLLYTAYVINL